MKKQTGFWYWFERAGDFIAMFLYLVWGLLGWMIAIFFPFTEYGLIGALLGVSTIYFFRNESSFKGQNTK